MRRYQFARLSLYGGDYVIQHLEGAFGMRAADNVVPAHHARIMTNWGYLKLPHIRSVQDDGPDELCNALALCPNHHALFDEGMWTLHGKTIILRQGLPQEIRRTFRRNINCNWDLDRKELEWHRTNVFKKETLPKPAMQAMRFARG